MQRFSARSLLGLSFVLGACQVDADPKPGPKTVPSPPPNVEASRLVVWVGRPSDTDANGFLDTFDVIVQVFSDSYPYASIRVPGSFEFKLKGHDSRMIAEWKIPQAAADAAVRIAGPGPGYYFRLNLRDKGTYQLPPQSAELFVDFVPVRGDPVHAPLNPIQVGRQAW